jgi:hypothetical protein
MGRTWPNMDGETIVEPGYYWNEKLKKLARLQIGEKVPRHVGPWEMVAGEGDESSSQIARRLFDRYPNMDINEFTYTTTSPLPRRLPMGDRPFVSPAVSLAVGLAGLLALGASIAWWLSSRAPARRAPKGMLVRRRVRPIRAAMLEQELHRMAVP